MDYSQLAFYQKARLVSREVDQEIKGWPKTMQAQAISRQLFRAATSVGANVAEGHGRHVGKEYVHFLFIAQGSANEVDHWLNTAIDCRTGDHQNLERLTHMNNETRRMLASTIRTLQAKQGSKLREDTAPYSPHPFSMNSESDIPSNS